MDVREEPLYKARIAPSRLNLVDDASLVDVVEKAGVVVIAPGAASSVDIDMIVSLARQAGKPVVAYGVSLAGLAKQLGILHFCPYGRR
ncbi:MAG: hypothetical protein JZD41_08845 [Thermoproteus sp.]|nr:hypothetical protein [Thermoproteus sp.]